MGKDRNNRTRAVPMTGYILQRSADEGDPRAISGRAIVFGEPTVLYEDDKLVIRETIAAEAVTPELLRSSDIMLTMYHNPEIILGRSKHGEGNLEITISDGGLDLTASLPETGDCDTALALIRGGQIDGCSFWAVVDRKSYESGVVMSRDDKGRKVADYTVKKIERLKDLTVCPNPAFPQTYVDAVVRSLTEENIDKSIKTLNDMPETVNENVTDVTRNDAAVQEPQGAVQNNGAVEEIRREMGDLSRRVGAIERRPLATMQTAPDAYNISRAIRDIVRRGQATELQLQRAEDGGSSSTPAVVNTTVAESGGIIPLTVGEVVKPLREGVIYDKIGIRLPTGLHGDYYWPVVGSSLEAEVAGESVELTPQSLTLSKVTAARQRLGVTVTLTREAIFQSNGLLEQIVREQMPLSVADLLNAVLLGNTAKGQLKGPFAQTGVTTKTLANAYGTATFKELNTLKAELLNAGYSAQGLVWTMSEGTKATLEACPIDSGSGRMVCENDRICGLPVFTSHVMGTKIGLGDWRYQVCGQFDTPSFIVDPYTGARKNEVYLTLNVNAATATLRTGAFMLISPKAS